MLSKLSPKGLLHLVVLVVAIGGLLLGFDTGVISGAIPFFQKEFLIDDRVVEFVASIGLFGAMFGAICGGRLADRIGRKKILLLSAIIFIVGALGSGYSPSIYHLIIARLFLGIAIGLSSFTVPLYIAEIAPSRSRGKLVSLFQVMMSLGILLSYISDAYFANDIDMTCWRPMFYVGVIPAFVLFVGMLCMPETPRWLMSKGHKEEALILLNKLGVDICFDDFLSLERKDNVKIQADWKVLLQPWLRTPLIICIGIMFFQQFVGINTVIYYSPKIFIMAGFGGLVSAVWVSVFIGVVNVICALVATFLVDRLGRRKLYFVGLFGILFSLILLSCCFIYMNQLGCIGKWLALVSLLLYVSFFALSLGPLAWLIVSEIFPQNLRGLGSSIGSFSVWLFNAIVSFTFFKIVDCLSIEGIELSIDGSVIANPAGAFLFYTGITLLAMIWGYFYIPETKGLSLEAIEYFWKFENNPRKMNDFKLLKQ